MADDWSIQVPLSALVALQGLPGRMESLEKENIQLRKEVDALRRINSQALQLLGDLRREIRTGKHGGQAPSPFEKNNS